MMSSLSVDRRNWRHDSGVVPDIEEVAYFPGSGLFKQVKHESDSWIDLTMDSEGSSDSETDSPAVTLILSSAQEDIKQEDSKGMSSTPKEADLSSGPHSFEFAIPPTPAPTPEKVVPRQTAKTGLPGSERGEKDSDTAGGGHVSTAPLKPDPSTISKSGDFGWRTSSCNCMFGKPSASPSLYDILIRSEGRGRNSATVTRPMTVITQTAVSAVVDQPQPSVDGQHQVPANGLLQAPTNGPLQAPTNGPIQVPAKGPIQPPANGPLQAPAKGPLQAPTNGPLQPPANGPLQAPTNGPTQPPASGPRQAPANGPLQPPANRPLQTPANSALHASLNGLKAFTSGLLRTSANDPLQHLANGPFQPSDNGPLRAPANGPLQAPANKPHQIPAYGPFQTLTKGSFQASANGPLQPPVNESIQAPGNRPIQPPAIPQFQTLTNGPLQAVLSHNPVDGPQIAPVDRPQITPVDGPPLTPVQVPPITPVDGPILTTLNGPVPNIDHGPAAENGSMAESGEPPVPDIGSVTLYGPGTEVGECSAEKGSGVVFSPSFGSGSGIGWDSAAFGSGMIFSQSPCPGIGFGSTPIPTTDPGDKLGLFPPSMASASPVKPDPDQTAATCDPDLARFSASQHTVARYYFGNDGVLPPQDPVQPAPSEAGKPFAIFGPVAKKRRLGTYCHECGTRHPMPTAKYCCMCGEKRIHFML